MLKFLKKMKKGFTLVELLVVIGVIGVLAAGLVAVINPADRVNNANDATVLGDFAQVIGGIQAYAASNDGQYPTAANWGALTAALVPGQLSNVPQQPTTTHAYTAVVSANSVLLHSRLISNKYTANCSGAGNLPYAVFSQTATGGTGRLCGACSSGAVNTSTACSTTWSL